MATLSPLQSFVSVNFDGIIFASPLLDQSQGKPLLIVPVSNGVIAALDAETGAIAWQIDVPKPQGQQVHLVATPVIVNNKLIVLFQCLDRNGVRISHRLAVIDLLQKKLDDRFSVLELSAEQAEANSQSVVKFNPPTAYSHAALKHAGQTESRLGYVYAAFGNAGDTQPFHGWLFEVDLDAWLQQSTKHAISGVLLTTPETSCPVTLDYGTQEMICGGGIWSPAGPQIYPKGNSYDIFVPTGNGQINLKRRDYANTLMRVKPGLKFEPDCDVELCKHFDPANPTNDCMQSCKNLFIPRLAAENAPLKPANRECDDKSYWECLAWMDYDLGANVPVKAELPDGRSVLIQPGKDGSAYLLDAEHLGIQYDRMQIVEVCGSATDPCKIPWAGMIVTQPTLNYIDETPVVVIPTFAPDNSHPAGLIALKIVLSNGEPKFERFWQFPEPSGANALKSFRTQPSLPVLTQSGVNGEPVVWIVDIGDPGTIYGVRVKDGKLLAKTSMQGSGRPLVSPLIHGDSLYAVSTLPKTNQSLLEGFKIKID